MLDAGEKIDNGEYQTYCPGLFIRAILQHNNNAFNRCQGINLPNHIENSKLKLKCFKDTYFRPTLAVVEVSNNLFGWSTHIWPLTNVKPHTSLPGCDIARCCVEVDIPKITFQSQTLQHFVGSRKNTRCWWNANREYIFFCQTASIVWIPNFSVYSKQMQNYCLPKANTIQFLIQSETLQRGQWTMATKFAKIQVVSLRFIWKSRQGIFLTQISSTSWKAVGGGWVGD